MSCLRASGIAVLLLLVTLQAAAQGYQPAAEYQSLLNLRFYEANGGFNVDGLQVVFPPQGAEASLVVSGGGGAPVTIPLRVEPAGDFPAFGRLVANSGPGIFQLNKAGDFTMTLQVNGEAVTTLPFTLEGGSSGDPFNPKTSYRRAGPWADLAYFSAPVDDPAGLVKINWWSSLREVPDAGSRAMLTVHILKGGKEVAATTSNTVLSNDDWQFFSREIARGSSEYLTLKNLAATDGGCEVVIKADGKPIKTFPFTVAAGKLLPHGRSALDYAPHTDFLSPRLVDMSSGSSSSYKMLEAYWMQAK
ncbi:MAG: hypothetical protein R2834_16710 [Rhodothermales bacterium]